MSTRTLLATAAVAALVCVLLTPLAMLGARRLGIMDHPGGRKAHTRTTPLLGGFAVLGATGAAVWTAMVSGSELSPGLLLALGAGTAVMLFAGLMDDLHGLSPRQKIAAQLAAIAAAFISLAAVNVHAQSCTIAQPLIAGTLSVAWIVVVANAVNLFDNMNGLCAGSAAVAATCLAAFNAHYGALTAAVSAAALAGACAGFLPYNWPRARIFLGDAGSMAIGFMLAATAVMGLCTAATPVSADAVLVPVLILALPLTDAVVVATLRLRAGHPPWIADRRHASHRMVRRGLAPWAGVLILWLAGAACGAAALLLPQAEPARIPWIISAVVLLVASVFAVAGSRGLD